MTLNTCIKEVDMSINSFIESLPDFPLYHPVSYLLNLGGKRLRPALTLMGNSLYRGHKEDAIHPALAIEVFHNFSLMHDDIMDKAPLRRGEKTVHEKWNANTAILSGDAMLVQAYELVLNTRPEFIRPINTLFSRTALEVCEGQQMDMDFETRNDVSLDEYLEMIKLKTSVLLGCALKIGAISAGASEKEADLLYDYGLHMGMAFQLRDDYLDAFGESHKVGKQKGGDILANKKTYLAIRALDVATPDQKSTLRSLLEEPDPEKKVSQTLDLFTALSVDKDILSLADTYFTRAVDALNKTTGDPEVKSELLAFSEQLMQREH